MTTPGVGGNLEGVEPKHKLEVIYCSTEIMWFVLCERVDWQGTTCGQHTHTHTWNVLWEILFITMDHTPTGERALSGASWYHRHVFHMFV